MKTILLFLALVCWSTSAIAACAGTSVPVENCGAVGGAKSIQASTTISTGNVVGPTGTWVIGDVGKVFYCIDTSTTAPVIAMTTITGFTNSSHITVGANANQTLGAAWCAWAVQDDTAAFAAATAAVTVTDVAGSPIQPNVGFGNFNGPSGTVTFCGGYLVSGPLFLHFTNGPSPNLVGCGSSSAVIYITPAASLLTPLVTVVGPGATVQGFTMTGLGQTFAGGHDLIRFNQAAEFRIKDVQIRNICSADPGPVFNIENSQNASITDVTIQNGTGAATCQQTACNFQGDGEMSINNILCSNFFFNLNIQDNPGARGPSGSSLNFYGGIIDECFGGSTSTHGCTALFNAQANFYGTTHYSPNTLNGTVAVSVDPTSHLWTFGIQAGQYFSLGSGSGLYVASGGVVTSAGSTWRANNSLPAVHNLGKFIDAGGNDYLKCDQTTCAAKSASQVFSGKLPVTK